MVDHSLLLSQDQAEGQQPTPLQVNTVASAVAVLQHHQHSAARCGATEDAALVITLPVV